MPTSFHFEKLLANALLDLNTYKANDIAWEYYIHSNFPMTWIGNSKRLNIKTELFTCCTLIDFGYPQGTILHFTHDNKIYGTSELYGTEPVFYDGEFKLNLHDFTLSITELKQGKIRFEPKIET
jgi:hypothetical protein